ncbi:unnamed protein product (macronuclear) [Paramecium tetraurelia]|uniref:Transmembrane protein n=1 Tax=Paramecium tetraurelia TaxID=5888 RepID=A0CCL4_PARTE|nr:uncharacterized protein GSPATT00037316001 [Paramecium tetraurelia]CAK68531.1 unnamed protein product [Paramecium tetraurelia]|eukprot:XP_001435928.1 hypothetical protein (macronuclear) [Paramecium tetraurelia strain d4-2]
MHYKAFQQTHSMNLFKFIRYPNIHQPQIQISKHVSSYVIFMVYSLSFSTLSVPPIHTDQTFTLLCVSINVQCNIPIQSTISNFQSKTLYLSALIQMKISTKSLNGKLPSLHNPPLNVPNCYHCFVDLHKFTTLSGSCYSKKNACFTQEQECQTYLFSYFRILFKLLSPRFLQDQQKIILDQFVSFHQIRFTSIPIMQILQVLSQDLHIISILANSQSGIISSQLQLLMLQYQIPICYSSFQTKVQSSAQNQIAFIVQSQDYKTSLIIFVEVGITVNSSLPQWNLYESQFKDLNYKGSVISSYAAIIQLKVFRYFFFINLICYYYFNNNFFQIQSIIGQKITFISTNHQGTSPILILPCILCNIESQLL